MKKLSIVLVIIICITLVGCSHHHRYKNGICRCGQYIPEGIFLNWSMNEETDIYIDFYPNLKEIKRSNTYTYQNGIKTIEFKLDYSGLTNVPETDYIFDIKYNKITLESTAFPYEDISDDILNYMSFSLYRNDELLESSLNLLQIIEAIDNLANNELVSYYNLPTNFQEEMSYTIVCDYHFPKDYSINLVNFDDDDFFQSNGIVIISDYNFVVTVYQVD